MIDNCNDSYEGSIPLKEKSHISLIRKMKREERICKPLDPKVSNFSSRR